MSSALSLSDLSSSKSTDLTDSSKNDCYKCNACDEMFPLDHLKTHIKVHTKNNLVWFQCEKSFSSQGGFYYHMKAPIREKSYSCIQCDKVFILDGQLKKHLETVHNWELTVRPKTNLVCNQCDKSFHRQSYFNYHMKAHSGKNSYSCTQCDKAFIKKGQMKLHIKTVHKLKINPKLCTQCGKSFSSQGGFAYHSKAHKGEKSCVCSQCNKAFFIPGQLKRHIQTVHDLETPYKCNECNKDFSQSGNLKTHIQRRHNGDRLYECKLCYKSFDVAKRLERHICKIVIPKFENDSEEGELHNTLEEGELFV